MTIRFLMMAAILVAGSGMSASAATRRHVHVNRAHAYRVHAHHHRFARARDSIARDEAEFAGVRDRRPYLPLAGTVGTPIPPEAARYMGYPYNVPGYRYEYADACLLRVGGVFGPGPSIAPCFPGLGF